MTTFRPGNTLAKPAKGTAKRAHRRRSRLTSADERFHKTAVRARDRYCRMPGCGCWKTRLFPHVAHEQHKGMGGNPTGERSLASRMVLLCGPRHRENRVSIDNGTLRWRYLNDEKRAHGNLAWDVDVRALTRSLGQLTGDPEWVEIAREVDLHVYATATPTQKQILDQLATMTL